MIPESRYISKYKWAKVYRQLLEDCAAVLADEVSKATQSPHETSQAETKLMPHFQQYLNDTTSIYH